MKLKNRMGRGGEAAVYATDDPAVVAKVYHHPPTMERLTKLQLMVRASPAATHSMGGGVAWPLVLLENKGTVVGYLMPVVSHALQLTTFLQAASRQSAAPGFTWRSLHLLAYNIATVFEGLHRGGYVIGDVNQRNLLVRPSALVVLTDIDSIQICEKGRVYRCPVGTAEYTPPEFQLSQRKYEDLDRNPSSDVFGLGVLIFQLVFGRHPYRGHWTGLGDPPPVEASIRSGHYIFHPMSPMKPASTTLSPRALPASLLTLFRRCFIDGHSHPYARPSASEWRAEMQRCLNELTQCSRNPKHFHYRTTKCVFCEFAQMHCFDLFPVGPVIGRAAA